MAWKGRFKPKNPEKYLGDPTNIIYRSSYELKFFTFCDNHPQIIKWASEELAIPYHFNGRWRRYYPDVYVQKKVGNEIIEELIEIKPKSQTSPPKKPKKMTKRFIREAHTYAKNEAKWDAAAAYCYKRGWKWSIFTEDELNIK